MGVTRTDFTEKLKVNAYRWFWEAATSNYDTWTELFAEDTDFPEDASYTMTTSALGLGDLKEKKEGDKLEFDSPMEGYSVLGAPKTFGRQISFSLELYSDTQVEGLFRKTVASWRDAYERTRDKTFAKIFNYGAYTAGHSIFNNSIPGVIQDPSGDFIYDGKPLFAAAGNEHVSKGGGTYYNFQALALNAANLKTVYTAMTTTNAKDERDEDIDIVPDVLLVPPALKFTAEEILKSTSLDSNNPGVTNVLRDIVRPVVWRRLTDSDGWILMQSKKGIYVINKLDPVIDFWVDPETKDYRASIVCRFGIYVQNWRFVYGCNLAQS